MSRLGRGRLRRTPASSLQTHPVPRSFLPGSDSRPDDFKELPLQHLPVHLRVLFRALLPLSHCTIRESRELSVTRASEAPA